MSCYNFQGQFQLHTIPFSSDLAVHKIRTCNLQVESLMLCSNTSAPLGTLVIHNPASQSLECFPPTDADPGDVLVYTGTSPYGVEWQPLPAAGSTPAPSTLGLSSVVLEARTITTSWTTAGGLAPLDYDTATLYPPTTTDYVYPATLNPSDIGINTQGVYLAQATIPLSRQAGGDSSQMIFRFELNTVPLPGTFYTPQIVSTTPPGPPIQRAFSVSCHTLFPANPGDILRITGLSIVNNSVVFITDANTLVVSVIRLQ